jgi:uncharacterized protein (DUF58 family)
MSASTRTRWIPGRRLALYALFALALYAIPGPGALAGMAFTALLVLAAIYEAAVLGRAAPEAVRKLDARLLVGTENPVSVRVYNASALHLRVTLRDDVPGSFTVSDEELSCELPPHTRRELSYRVTPSRRGRYAFGALHLRVEGLFALGAAIATIDAAARARVYPNLRGPRRYELAARLGALHSVGVRTLRRPGGGGEFEQLREYVAGDSYRDVDWKATAKRLRPVTRVLDQEQSQTVVVALDAGRMMATQLDALSKLDHAINAALLLTYVALRSGDKVGLVVFAHDVLDFVPPRRGPTQYRRVLEVLTGVEANSTYVDFRRFAEFVRVRLPRRALLVMFSDLLDESQAMPLADSAPLLRQRHLPLCVSMNDPVAEGLAFASVESGDDAYRRAAAASILDDREAIKLHLRKSGVGILEAKAGELAIATVNRYLEIKSRHAL